MDATDHQRHMASLAGLYAARPRPRLLHVRHAGSAVLAALAMPDGSVSMLRVTSADHPELDALPAGDRARVRSAFLALHGGQPDAA